MPSLRARPSRASTGRLLGSVPTSARTYAASSTGCSPSRCPTTVAAVRGGWNCEAPKRSTRSSFNTTICVLHALLEHERAGNGTPAVTQARLRGQEYLLERRLFRRLSTGEVMERDRKGGAALTRFAFPTWWHYDVLRALEYLRSAGAIPDERVAEAIELTASKRDGKGGGRSRRGIPA
jgi:hypothetical protein